MTYITEAVLGYAILSSSVETSVQPYRVLLIDDHPIVLLGLRLTLEAEPHFAVCGEAATALLAREAVSSLAPDLAIADLVLGGADGAAMIEDLLTVRPDLLVLVYSSCDERRYAPSAIRAGAKGFVSKAAGLTIVAEALGGVARGEIYLSNVAEQAVLDEKAERSSVRQASDGLSARELQVLELIAEGWEIRAIAARLGLSVKTVGTYRERLKVKLGLDSARALERVAPMLAAGSDGSSSR